LRDRRVGLAERLRVDADDVLASERRKGRGAGVRRARSATDGRQTGESAQSEREGDQRLAKAPEHAYKPIGRRGGRQHYPRSRLSAAMSPTWIWMQIAIVVFVAIGMVLAITKLA
jgi:hypothetical protein